MLRGIVEQPRLGPVPMGGADDLLQRLAFQTRPFQQFVSVVDIRLVVEVVMELEGLLRHPTRGKSVVGIGKVRKFKGHGVAPDG